MGEPVIRLATFNVQHGRLPSGAVDLGVLATACAALDADVLALQELDDGLERSHNSDMTATIARATGHNHVFGPAVEVRGGRYGNALLVRGELDDIEVVPLDDPKEPRCGIVARVRLVSGPELSVAATHLGLRGEGCNQLPMLLDRLRARPGPRALLGDLNLQPEDVEPLAADADFLRVAGAPTYPASKPRREIDHVLLDGLTETAVVVVPLPVSDHRALVVEIA